LGVDLGQRNLSRIVARSARAGDSVLPPLDPSAACGRVRRWIESQAISGDPIQRRDRDEPLGRVVAGEHLDQLRYRRLVV